MGIYGEPAKRLIQSHQPIIITLEDSTEENQLLEANVIISNKGKDVELYIRDSHQATSGPSISKDKKKSTMNHGSSVKLRTPRSITGDEGTPIEIHGNKIVFDENKYSELKDIPDYVKKMSKKFLSNNLADLNEMWGKKNSHDDFESWKKIIDRSYKDIKEIESVSKEIKEYLDTKKGRKTDESSK